MTDNVDTTTADGPGTSAPTPPGVDMQFDHWSSKMAYSPYDVWARLLFRCRNDSARARQLGLRFFGTKATAVLTNVPGPRQPLYIAGRRIDKLMFWVPQSGHMALGISILSYAGGVMLGVATDEGVVPDPERIVDAFKVEFEAMRKAARSAERRPGRRASPPGGAAARPGRPPH